MRDYIVDGVPLRDPQGEWFIDYSRSDLGGEIERIIPSGNLYGYHGAYGSSESFFSTATESLVLNIQGQTKEIYNKNFRALSGLLLRPELYVQSAPQRTPLYSAVRSGATFDLLEGVREASMRTVGSLAVERLNERAARVTAILERQEAFWQSVDLFTSDSVPLSGNDQLELEYWAGDSTAPITSVLLRVQGPVSAGGYVQLLDQDNPLRSVRLNIMSALSDTQYIILDTYTLNAVKMTGDAYSWATSGGTDLSNDIEVVGEGVFSISPSTASTSFPDNPLRYFVTIHSFNAAGSSVQLRGKRAYLS